LEGNKMSKNSKVAFDQDAGTTEKGKDLGIYQVLNTSLYKIAFKQGGELPKELTGMYTSPRLAQETIDKYLNNRKAA